ncbi:MAG: DNA repair protein RadA [Clostridiales bacterium]|nr:DNA repair protein RadA [Clostridiales bacterium]
MAKEKTLFACTACGFETPKWVGKCPGCGAWNTMEEAAVITGTAAGKSGKIAANQRPGTGASPMLLGDIPEDVTVRVSTGIGELDRVLGGSAADNSGLVEGALMLIGGDPGVGKSTLLLQVCANLARSGKRVLYVSGEESAKQIKLRANRLGVTNMPNLYVLAENALDAVEEKLRHLQPDVAVIDSVQTMYRPDMPSAPGSVSQIRECTSLVMRVCKETGIACFLVGHVTKDGAIAGPRLLEHMVDVVLYFEGDKMQEYRLLRAVKNRFGSVNELGVFQMTGEGMVEVLNPSEQLLSRRAKGASGSVVFCGLEGSRPLLCDVQALASQSYFGTPRRTVGGADTSRVALLLAVLEKRANQKTYNQDVYINVAGGLELSEPAADLALCLAVVSSLRDEAIGADVAVMGEVGLAGEVRAIPQCDRRIAECRRLGFTTIVLPRENLRRIKDEEGVKLIGVDTVMQAISVLF